jgi:hypothetical protein
VASRVRALCTVGAEKPYSQHGSRQPNTEWQARCTKGKVSGGDFGRPGCGSANQVPCERDLYNHHTPAISSLAGPPSANLADPGHARVLITTATTAVLARSCGYAAPVLGCTTPVLACAVPAPGWADLSDSDTIPTHSDTDPAADPGCTAADRHKLLWL